MAPVLTTGPPSRPLIRRSARCATACATNGAWIGCLHVCVMMREGEEERGGQERGEGEHPVVPSVRPSVKGLEPRQVPPLNLARASRRQRGYKQDLRRTRMHTQTHTSPEVGRAPRSYAKVRILVPTQREGPVQALSREKQNMGVVAASRISSSRHVIGRPAALPGKR